MTRTAYLRGVLAGLVLAMMIAPSRAEEGPQNLDAGKTPAQLFASDCSGCHKTPQGLAKSGGLFGRLSGFLREHYTASKETAAVLSAYLQSFGDAPSAPARSRQAKRPPKADQKTKTDGASAAGDGKKSDEKKSDEKKPPARANSDSAKPSDSAPSGGNASESKPKENSGAGATPPAAKPADGGSDKKE